MYFHSLTGFALSQVKEPRLSCQQVGLKLCYSVSWVCIHSSVHVNNQYYFFKVSSYLFFATTKCWNIQLLFAQNNHCTWCNFYDNLHVHCTICYRSKLNSALKFFNQHEGWFFPLYPSLNSWIIRVGDKGNRESTKDKQFSPEFNSDL